MINFPSAFEWVKPGHSQNVSIDLATTSSWALPFGNAPTLGLYPAHNSPNVSCPFPT